MISTPINIKTEDAPITLIYYSSLHDELVEKIIQAVVTEEGQALIFTINERVMDESYVYIGQL